jgi:hypothetical protein
MPIPVTASMPTIAVRRKVFFMVSSLLVRTRPVGRHPWSTTRRCVRSETYIRAVADGEFLDKPRQKKHDSLTNSLFAFCGGLVPWRTRGRIRPETVAWRG